MLLVILFSPSSSLSLSDTKPNRRFSSFNPCYFFVEGGNDVGWSDGCAAVKLGFRVEAAVTRRVMGDCAKKNHCILD